MVMHKVDMFEIIEISKWSPLVIYNLMKSCSRFKNITQQSINGNMKDLANVNTSSVFVVPMRYQDMFKCVLATFKK